MNKDGIDVSMDGIINLYDDGVDACGANMGVGDMGVTSVGMGTMSVGVVIAYVDTVDGVVVGDMGMGNVNT